MKGDGGKSSGAGGGLAGKVSEDTFTYIHLQGGRRKQDRSKQPPVFGGKREKNRWENIAKCNCRRENALSEGSKMLAYIDKKID